MLVAVSGGPDSVALLAALHALRPELALTLVVAHLHHGLRGAESDADQALVEHLAATLGLACLAERVVLPPGNVEAEARRARYAFLERAADATGATVIATGHTLEDQAETLLLRLASGAGRRGLGGIRPRRGRIIRPLILCDRVQVRAFLVDHGLAWRRDRSNFDLGLRRARVRLGLLPTLARELNPRLARSLARLADVQRDEDRLLDRLAARVGTERPTLDVATLVALEPALARRAVRLWWRRQGGDRRLGLGHVEAVLHLLRRPHDGIARVPGGAVARVGGVLKVGSDGRATPAAVAPYALTLAPGASIDTPSGWRLSLREAAPAEVTPGDAVCVLDADHVIGDLRVRNRRPGDRLRLQGLGGRTSIKRLFITRRIPRAARDGYPLVLVGEAILWVPWCGRSDVALVSASTGRVLVVEATPRIGASQ